MTADDINPDIELLCANQRCQRRETHDRAKIDSVPAQVPATVVRIVSLCPDCDGSGNKAYTEQWFDVDGQEVDQP
jgi:hypothetical protein